MEYLKNPQLKELQVKVIDNKLARAYIIKNHYMKTFPKAHVCFGVIYKGRLMGVYSFGHSTATREKVLKYVPDIKEGEYLEMQRMNIHDMLGANTESWAFSRIYKLIMHNTKVRVLVTHAGGCKNDCGIVYQGSNWLYFGKSKCNDFYLTKAGEYKNIIAPMRFGRVPKEERINGPQGVGEYLFGEGEIVNSFRYLYLYPIDKKLRPLLQSQAQEFPKDSAIFRKNQKWQKNELGKTN